MKPEQQRIKLAEWDGWTRIWDPAFRQWVQRSPDNSDVVCDPDPSADWETHRLPDYLSELNAVHELKRKALTTRELCDRFNKILYTEELPGRPVPYETDKWTWGQPADVQCRALLKTLGLWEDETK